MSFDLLVGEKGGFLEDWNIKRDIKQTADR